MKTLLLAGVVAASVSLGLPAAAVAVTCHTGALLGTWLSTDRGSGNAYCLVQFRKDGRIVVSSCPDLDTLTPESTLTGRLTVKKDCAVTGTLYEFKGGRKMHFEFTGTMNADKSRIAGRIKQNGEPGFGYKFVKQY